MKKEAAESKFNESTGKYVILSKDLVKQMIIIFGFDGVLSRYELSDEVFTFFVAFKRMHQSEISDSFNN